MTVLKAKVCAPSLLSAAYVLGRSLRLTITTLPEEVILKILSKLEMKDVLSVCRACHYLNHLASSNAIWKDLYIETFGG